MEGKREFAVCESFIKTIIYKFHHITEASITKQDYRGLNRPVQQQTNPRRGDQGRQETRKIWKECRYFVRHPMSSFVNGKCLECLKKFPTLHNA